MDPLGCWEWAGKRNEAGYGVFWDGRKGCPAHRWAYESLRAPIPDRLVIDHECSNRACVNPWHLDPVTAGENTRRSVMRGRRGGPNRDAPAAELTPIRGGFDGTDCERVVASIRRAVATGAFGPGDQIPSIATLARLHGVGATTVKVALAHLRASGEVRTRRGQGTFIPGRGLTSSD